jgi:NAD(P)H-dependent flavin oxidoreductase YrpB (nitropropane dioxygenase family)
MPIDSNADDIQLTAEVTGIPANMLRKSLERSGFKPVAKQRFARDLPSVAKS